MIVQTNIKGLTFKIGKDGVWMNTTANKLHTSINITNYAEERSGIIAAGLLLWCKQMEETYRGS